MSKWTFEIIFFVVTAAIVSWGSNYNGKGYHQNRNYQDNLNVFDSGVNDTHVNNLYQRSKQEIAGV